MGHVHEGMAIGSELVVRDFARIGANDFAGFGASFHLAVELHLPSADLFLGRVARATHDDCGLDVALFPGGGSLFERRKRRGNGWRGRQGRCGGDGGTGGEGGCRMGAGLGEVGTSARARRGRRRKRRKRWQGRGKAKGSGELFEFNHDLAALAEAQDVDAFPIAPLGNDIAFAADLKLIRVEIESGHHRQLKSRLGDHSRMEVSFRIHTPEPLEEFRSQRSRVAVKEGIDNGVGIVFPQNRCSRTRSGADSRCHGTLAFFDEGVVGGW